jgi:hypothetical protein
MFKKLRAELAKVAAAEVDRILNARDKRVEPPAGYNPVPVITGCLFEWLAVPFCGQRVLVQVRYPNSIDKNGEYTQIFLEQAKRENKSIEDTLRIMDTQEELAKQVLNVPTFAELEKEIYKRDRALESRREILRGIEEKMKPLGKPDRWPADVRERYYAEQLRSAYALPADTMLALSEIALATNLTDIRKVTKDMLLTAYQKSKLYKRPPSEFIPSGVYSAEQKSDIDDTALGVGYEWEEEQKQKRRGAIGG